MGIELDRRNLVQLNDPGLHARNIDAERPGRSTTYSVRTTTSDNPGAFRRPAGLMCKDAAHARVEHRSRPEVIVDVPVQYYQSVIAIEVAVTGVLLFQIRFFDTSTDARDESTADPRLRLLMLVVLAATIFGSLEAIREGGGRWPAISVTVGLAISLLPILLRVLPPLRRDVQTGQRRPDFWVTLLGLILFAAVVALVTID